MEGVNDPDDWSPCSGCLFYKHLDDANFNVVLYTMRGVTYSKLVFLDSQDGVRGAKALRPTFTVPSNDFSVGNEESIRLTLKSFSMPVQYYGINQSNSTFHYRSHNDQHEY